MYEITHHCASPPHTHNHVDKRFKGRNFGDLSYNQSTSTQCLLAKIYFLKVNKNHHKVTQFFIDYFSFRISGVPLYFFQKKNPILLVGFW